MITISTTLQRKSSVTCSALGRSNVFIRRKTLLSFFKSNFHFTLDAEYSIVGTHRTSATMGVRFCTCEFFFWGGGGMSAKDSCPMFTVLVPDLSGWTTFSVMALSWTLLPADTEAGVFIRTAIPRPQATMGVRFCTCEVFFGGRGAWVSRNGVSNLV